MQGKTLNKKTPTNNRLPAPPIDRISDQRKEERRKCACKGYTYITMVGWVCRREHERRNKGDC